MAEYGSLIATKLFNDSTLTALLDTFVSNAAIFQDNVAPESFTGDDFILFYLTGPKDYNIPYNDEQYTINCRAATYAGSKAIATRVITVLNRCNPDANSLIRLSLMPTIQPQDSTDTYNTPIEITLNRR